MNMNFYRRCFTMLMWCLYLSALALTALWAGLGGVTALSQL